MASITASRNQPDYVETLKRERDRFVALAFCAADVLFEVDGNRKITYAAGATKALTGRDPEEVIGRRFIDLIGDHDRHHVEERLRSLSTANRLEPLVVRLMGATAPTPAMMLTGYHLPDLPGSYFFALRLTGKNEAGQPVDDGLHDIETGLLTRDAFTAEASRRIRAAHEEADELRLTMIRVNDIAGLRSQLDQEADRELMKTLGACIAGDSGQETAGRFDDENYGLLHDTGFDVDGLKLRIGEHLRSADPRGAGLDVGSATVPADIGGAEPADLAKALLYTINQFCDDPNAEPEIRTLSENFDALVEDASNKMSYFREIVSADNFDAVYQPIVDLRTRTIHHYEALARFGGGLERSPYELITFAENTGLICDFDFAMFRKMLDALHTWKRKGKPRMVAVNLSGRSLGNDAFVAAMLKLLAKHTDLRKYLLIEVTESSRIRDLRHANTVIQSLRQAGHQVCLDDFGAGASALKYLHALDVDVVKIDGQYIQTAHEERKLRAFLKAIAGLCSELNIDTIAEMVEDEATLPLLAECGIQFGQGYLFGKPSIRIEDFETERKKAAPKRNGGGWSRIARG